MAFKTTNELLEFNKVLELAARYAVTEMGKNDILGLAPMQNIQASLNEGDLVTQAKEVLIHQTEPPLEALPDLTEALSMSTVENAVLNSKKILHILRLAASSRTLANYLKDNEELAPGIAELAKNLFVDKLFERHINQVVDENGEVKDSASKELSSIRKDIRDKSADLQKMVNRLIKEFSDKNYVREDYVTLRDGRIVVPVKAQHKRQIKGFIHSESSTGQTVYIEPEQTLNLNNDIVSLSFAEKREIERILRELTGMIGGRAAELKTSLSIIGRLDSFFARARYSIEIIGAFPEINNDKPFAVSDARHPLLISRIGRDKTVPVSFEIKDNRVIIITGPNAGGKTVTIKTIGLLALMAMAGLHIPASADSNIHFFKKVLIDIGDAQSIEDDLSTFSSHLSRIKSILENAGNDTLVLLDEIGTGTDPSAGAALATAILVDLEEKGSTVFATTHHGSLKIMANDREGFENASMEFDQENLSPTYRLNQGIPGSSYAFEIAERIGLEEKFLDKARGYLNTDEDKIERILLDIEKKSAGIRKKYNDLELENLRLKGLSDVYQKQVDKLEKEKKEILKKTKAEAENYLDESNRKIQRVIKEIRESGADRKSVKAAQNTLNELKDVNKNIYDEKVDLSDKKANFKAGDFVKLKDTNASGKIIEIDESKNEALVLVGSLKMHTKISDLQPAKSSEVKKESKPEATYDVSGVKTRLDIRGERPDEVEFEIVKFLDDAYQSGANRVEILHGKGTGALRNLVREILDNHEKVSGYKAAPVEFGGEGITIATFK